MIKPNTQKSNNSKAPLGGLASNTRLIPPNTTPTTTNKTFKASANKELRQIDSSDKDVAVFHNHLDWLTVNFTRLTEQKFRELLELVDRGLVVLETDKSWSSGEKAKTYQSSISSPIGLKGAYSTYKAENGIDNHYDVTISLSGEYFASLTSIKQWELYKDLYHKYSATCSRTDTSIDDYTFKKIPLNKMIEAYRRGDYFDFQTYHHETDESDPNNPTTVHYFGAKGSKKLVRVYKHQNKSLRLETQFRGKYAQVALKTIATLEREDETDDEWEKIIQKTIGGMAVGAIDFRDKSKLKNRSKACKSKTTRFPWWQDFIDTIGAVHMIRIPVVKPDLTTYQNKFNWLEKVTSKTFAIIFHLIGEDKFIRYIYKLVRLGESKFTSQDKKNIEYLRDNFEYLDLG